MNRPFDRGGKYPFSGEFTVCVLEERGVDQKSVLTFRRTAGSTER